MLFLPKGTYSHSIPLIRDTEIETAIKELAKPIFEAAKISDIELHIVNSPQVNAFTNGGKNLFIYTGLLLEELNPETIMGVIAHECGHITAHHVIHNQAKLNNANRLMGVLLLAELALVSIGVEAAIAAPTITTNAIQQELLSHSRKQELVADLRALKYLQKSKISPNGLISFFSKNAILEHKLIQYIPEYYRTHPLDSHRSETLQQYLSSMNFENSWLNDKKRLQYSFAIAKLRGYLKPHRNLSFMSEENPENIYEKSIAHYISGKTQKAYKLLNRLIEQYPENPFFLETKAEFLLSSGELIKSSNCIQKALTLKPDSALFHILYAKILITKKKQTEAFHHLRISVDLEPNNIIAFRLLGIVSKKLKNEYLSYLCFSKYNLGQNKLPLAEKFLERAEKIEKKDDSIFAKSLYHNIKNDLQESKF